MLRDLAFAWRMLRRRPGFFALAVAPIALGIGASCTVFSAFEAVLLRPPGITEPDRVTLIWETNVARGESEVEVSHPDFVDWQQQNRTFTNLAVMLSVNLGATLSGAGEPEKVPANAVSGDFFGLLGTRPLLGRTLEPADDRTGAPQVVVISEGLWRRRYGGDPAIIGRRVTLDREPATVVGVMPAAFDVPRGCQLWGAITPGSEGWIKDRSFRVLIGLGRLREGASWQAARADLDAIAARLSSAHPKENGGYGIRFEAFEDHLYGSARLALRVLLGAVLLVLLIACANVANLFLARATARERELVVRAALGAGRARLVRLLLAESALVAAIGGGLGLLASAWGTDVIHALAPSDVPGIDGASLDARVAGFAILLVFATTLLCGIVPVLRAGKSDLASALRAASGGAIVGGRLRGLLVVAEVALAIVLCAGAGLLVQTFVGLRGVDPGFDPAGVLTARLELSESRHPDPVRRAALYQQLIDRVATLPRVESAAAVLMRPLSGTVGWDYPFAIEGQSAEETAHNPYSNYEVVSAGYFHTMRIPLVEGREFTRADDRNVAIINQSTARRFWPTGGAIGRRLRFGKADSKKPWLTIVGVVRDGRYREWHAVRPDIYVPMLQENQPRTDLVIRTTGNPRELAAALRREVAALDPEQPLSEVVMLDELVAQVLARPRFNMWLLVALALLALALAAIGVYSVMAYTVAMRRREIGLRMALGAGERDVVGMVVRQAAWLAGAGALVGVPLAFALSRLLAGILYGVTPGQPLALAGAAALLVAIALGAAFVPASRAAKTSPLTALRSE